MTITDVRANFESLLRFVHAGGRVRITVRGQPVALMVPVAGATPARDKKSIKKPRLTR